MVQVDVQFTMPGLFTDRHVRWTAAPGTPCAICGHWSDGSVRLQVRVSDGRSRKVLDGRFPDWVVEQVAANSRRDILLPANTVAHRRNFRATIPVLLALIVVLVVPAVMRVSPSPEATLSATEQAGIQISETLVDTLASSVRAATSTHVRPSSPIPAAVAASPTAAAAIAASNPTVSSEPTVQPTSAHVESAPAAREAPNATVVRANLDWQPTGVRVRVGDAFTVRYVAGTWSECSKPGCVDVGADGHAGTALKGCPHAALVGRIGDAAPLCLGADFAGIAKNEGELALRINDDFISDNHGLVVVEIRILQ